jgi:phosphoglycerol transferase MdoB-like AlkP superfamily enzyme
VLLLLLLVYFCVLGGYFVLGISPFPHYFSVLFPTAALLFVLFLKKTDQWFPHHITVILTRSLVLLVVFANLIFSAAFFHYLDRWPKTIKGDYGMPYKYQSEESHQRLASHLQSISSTEERQRTYPASSASSAVRK